MRDAVNLAMKAKNQMNRTIVCIQDNFRRLTQETYSTPKSATTSDNNNNSEDATPIQNSAQNQSGTLAPVELTPKVETRYNKQPIRPLCAF